MSDYQLKHLVEGTLLAAGRPLTTEQLQALFEESERPSREAIREAVEALRADYAGRGVEIVEVASGYRLQVTKAMSARLAKLWEERPARLSRALLETLALIAYRQPITRGEIEDVRGVSVSTNIIRTLLERDWIRAVGHRDVPGRPALYGTTRAFLDYFNLKSLDELPSLMELKDLDRMSDELDLEPAGAPEGEPAGEAARGADEDHAAGAGGEPGAGEGASGGAADDELGDPFDSTRDEGGARASDAAPERSTVTTGADPADA
ncbi:MAG: SMC-Scp complex subunit ScpB [Gammaproteobacteria bacterium]|nr:SMC-Scp complex subunit ScpB [Gammaproteobacteria bacterium]NIR28844.1 SMC-Scp complex subunit ScpB [Gammaproteobacteria bacterium]NIR97225.1 SMC-Scp complex subunit ScpB [Gammaproteobacteria bacterium]NIT62936.1 SMC-Scp complex subunit ScpB [Gammaproteobacteria bacterium]NIV20626.1 SMC-Scp complex subunit ScpB [Gammaproteobacteria bacterium]